MVTLNIDFENSKKQILKGTLRYVENSSPTSLIPAVILLHDFGCHSEHELIVNLANNLLSAGFAIFRFDFHAHGQSDGELDDFHITQQIDDVNSAVDYLKKCEFIDKERIGIYGHGLGADVAILAAAKSEQIKCLVLHAPRADLGEHISSRFSEYELDELKHKEYLTHAIHGRIGKDFFEHLKKYDAKDEIKNVKVPVLFVHGTNDFTVPEMNSRTLFRLANEPKKLEIIEMADHDFRGEEIRQQLFDMVDEWFKKWLKK